MDPFHRSAAKANKAIPKNLQQQFEFLQPRNKYKILFDQEKMCIGLRKLSFNERVLFHYNGHGVTYPTVNGKSQVSNKQFIQYIPVSSIYVFDASGTRNATNSLIRYWFHHRHFSQILSSTM
jgi:regulator-associated protein of mTOR